MKRTIFAVVIFACLAVACRFATGNPESAAPIMAANAPINWSGDLDGSTLATQIVTGLEGKPLPPPTVGALQYDGGAYYWGAAGGSVSPGDAGQFYVTNDAGAVAQWVYPAGDVTTVGSNPGSLYVQSISGSAGAGTGTVNVVGSGSVTRDSFDMTHGRITAGGGGSDHFAEVGPVPGSETTLSAIWLLANGASATSTNPVIYSDGVNVNVNSLGTGPIWFVGAAATVYGQISSTQLYLGGYTTAAPLALSWSTATTPTITSGTSATSLTVGTNKSGATLALQADAATTYETLAATGITLGVSGGAQAHAINGSLAVTTRTSAASTLTVDTTTTDYVLLENTSSNAISLTLPAPTNGRILVLVDSTNSFCTHNLTLVRHASENIDGVAASKVYSACGTRATIVSDGTNWFTY
jgi:hypothetical protein